MGNVPEMPLNGDELRGKPQAKNRELFQRYDRYSCSAELHMLVVKVLDKR